MCDLPKKQEARIILQSLEQAMEVAGIASAKTDARCLLGLALGRDMPVLPHEVLSPLDTVCQKHLSAMLERRLVGEPISRLRGWREFWSLRFAISRSTLAPLPHSEPILAAAVPWPPDPKSPPCPPSRQRVPDAACPLSLHAPGCLPSPPDGA